MKTKLYYLALILMLCCCSSTTAEENQAQSNRIEACYVLKDTNGGVMGFVYKFEGKTIVLNYRGGVIAY